MTKDTNKIRDGLTALQVLSLADADEYLENLATEGLESLERMSKAPEQIAALVEAAKKIVEDMDTGYFMQDSHKAEVNRQKHEARIRAALEPFKVKHEN